MTIRASQVLCVYPLSEDVQVGDIYLVSTPIGNEAKEYQRRGFLSFDTLVTRLQPVGYPRMYLDAYRTKDNYHILPHQWQFPLNGSDPTDWASAPRAAFPSYSFSVARGQGLKLAVPVQAVPVGLSLMNSGKAHGSIEIADAVTYGIDQQSIDAQVDAWTACPNVSALLARYAPMQDAKTNEWREQYLRIVTRVYLTGRMNVTLQNDEARGGGLDVGVAQAVQVMDTKDAGATNKTAAQNYAEILNSLNASLNTPSQQPAPAPAAGTTPQASPAAAAPTTPAPAPAPAAPAAPAPAAPAPPAASAPATPAPAASAVPAPAAPAAPAAPTAVPGATVPKPGGSIRIAAASSRGITMNETFDRPLVVGYLAYDRRIGHGGKLGASTPTLLRVERRPAPDAMEEIPEDNVAKTRTMFGPDEKTLAIRAWLTQDGNREALGVWLESKNLKPKLIPAYINAAEHASLRQQIVDTFVIGGFCGK